jgi:CRISPR-associated exonuclease Cas4
MTGFVAIVLIVIGLAALMWSRGMRQASGLPRGEVIYTDTRGWGTIDQPLFSSVYRLTGKPDYLVKKGRRIVPVEVKSAHAPDDGPHHGHILQLAAYCLLVEEAYGHRPDYGIIRYADKTFSVDNTDELQSMLLDVLDEMHNATEAGYADRSHDEPQRCAPCGYRHACDERLA